MTIDEATRILKVAIEDSKEHISFCFDSRGIGALDMAIKALEQQRPKGRWIEQQDIHKHHYGWSFCSECGAFLMSSDGANYCSCCGAEMEAEA